MTNCRTHSSVPDILAEVVVTDKFKWVITADVDSIAFVFCAVRVNSGMCLCGDMQNANITWKMVSEDQQVCVLLSGDGPGQGQG